MVGTPELGINRKLAPSPMEMIEFQLGVPDSPSLDAVCRQSLRAEGALRPLQLRQTRLLLDEAGLGQVAVFSAEVQGVAVLITEDWVVLIMGPNIMGCVSAMCVLISLINSIFESPVSIRLATRTDDSAKSLHRMLVRRSMISVSKSLTFWVLSIVATAILSSTAGGLVVWIVEGG